MKNSIRESSLTLDTNQKPTTNTCNKNNVICQLKVGGNKMQFPIKISRISIIHRPQSTEYWQTLASYMYTKHTIHYQQHQVHNNTLTLHYVWHLLMLSALRTICAMKWN